MGYMRGLFTFENYNGVPNLRKTYEIWMRKIWCVSQSYLTARLSDICLPTWLQSSVTMPTCSRTLNFLFL